MPSKYEFAQNLAWDIARAHKKQVRFYTGRIIVSGDNTQDFGDLGDPKTFTEVILEYRLFTYLKRRLKRGIITSDTSRIGVPSMTHAELLPYQLEANTRKFKRRQDVIIFNKKGPVKKSWWKWKL